MNSTNESGSNDIIDFMTAEIEAIIQEENKINSISTNSNDEIAPIIVIIEKDEIIQNEETTINTESEALSELRTVNYVAAQEPTKNEPIQGQANDEVDLDSANCENIMDQFIEYTVEIPVPDEEIDSIGSTQTPDEQVEVEEVVVVNAPIHFKIIESILKEAPLDENDGPRARHLKQALRKALNNTIKSCSGEKLETCFPFNLKPQQMNSINSTITSTLQSVIDGIQGPFEDLINQENLIVKLNKVDEFTKSRVPGGVINSELNNPSLTPQHLIDRKLFATKVSVLSQLEEHLLSLENENINLSEELNDRHNDFAERLDRLKSSQQLIDVALDQISSVSMDDLESLVDKMNHQYQPGAIKFPTFSTIN